MKSKLGPILTLSYLIHLRLLPAITKRGFPVVEGRWEERGRAVSIAPTQSCLRLLPALTKRGFLVVEGSAEYM